MWSDAAASILVVDDNPATLYATTRVLRHAGFTVSQASTGSKAVELAGEGEIDLVVLDIDLPDINGYEVCRQIRARPSMARVRVVYLSASFIEDAHKVRGFEAGADGFLTHPVEPAVLKAAVAALLRTRAIEVELEQTIVRERVAREDAERANRSKDDFLATLSHELRNPLTAIIGWAEIAKVHSAGHEAMQHAVSVIIRNARLQTQLVSDLLDVSRIIAGKDLGIRMAPVRLGDVIGNSIESVVGAANAAGVHVEMESCDPSMYVNGDADRLQQVFSNLISNAIKFSERGTRVVVKCSTDPEHAMVTVCDEGCGISPALLPRIFDRFWQDDTSSRRTHGGLGLGLAIVKHLTELHGGTVSADSAGEGKGAMFTVTLPRVTAEAAARATADGEDDGAIELRCLKVLVVDDDDDAREWIHHVIAQAGADVVAAAGVDQALELVQRYDPDVVVSDLAMPRRNGFDLMLALRRGGHSAGHLPVIALSASASSSDEQQALAAGFQFFLAKPPDARKLLELVRQASRAKK